MAGLQEECYRRVVTGDGLTLADVRPGLELAYRVQTQALTSDAAHAHHLAREHLTRGRAF